MLISLGLNWFTARMGQRTTLRLGAVTYAIFLLVIGASGSVGGVLVAHALGGIA